MLSIIIPTLNEATRVERLLQSLAGLNHIEVIVVDGGSLDSTVLLARLYADIVIETHAGRAWQMNQGAQIASGDILWFLHADSIIPAHAVKTIDNACKKKAWGRFDIRLSGKQRLLKWVSFMMNKRSCLTQIATGDQGLFVHADLFHQIGGFPNIPLMEDIAISHRLKRKTRMCCLHSTLTTSSRRWQQNGILKTIILMWSLRLAYTIGISPEILYRIYY